MDLNKVTYLLALADTKNYSRAAEQCHISQPALTRYIKNLEEELNVTLFDRSSFPIRLTYAGERYIDGLLKILEMKEKLDKEMREIAGFRTISPSACTAPAVTAGFPAFFLTIRKSVPK